MVSKKKSIKSELKNKNNYISYIYFHKYYDMCETFLRYFGVHINVANILLFLF
jgi:hypothetical protein